MEIFKQLPHGEPIGLNDNNNVPIKVGDHMKVMHDCNCDYCDHIDIVEILWNEQWKVYGMKTLHGRWIGRASLGGFLISKS